MKNKIRITLSNPLQLESIQLALSESLLDTEVSFSFDENNSLDDSELDPEINLRLDLEKLDGLIHEISYKLGATEKIYEDLSILDILSDLQNSITDFQMSAGFVQPYN